MIYNKFSVRGILISMEGATEVVERGGKRGGCRKAGASSGLYAITWVLIRGRQEAQDGRIDWSE